MPASIAAEVAALIAVIERMEKRAEEDRAERKAEQESIKTALSADRTTAEMARSAVSTELRDIRHSQTDALRRLEKIEPVTDMVTSVRSLVTGGIMLLGVMGGVAWAGVAFFKDIIVGWFQ